MYLIMNLTAFLPKKLRLNVHVCMDYEMCSPIVECRQANDEMLWRLRRGSACIRVRVNKRATRLRHSPHVLHLFASLASGICKCN